MGFNFGAFAGGLGKGAMDTYTTLKDQQSREEASQRAERALRMQEDEALRLRTEREALRSAIGEIPQGDTVRVPTFQGMTGSYDQQDAPTRTEAITPEQKMANFRSRAVALGADPTAALQYEAGGLQLESSRQGLKKGTLEIGELERNARYARNTEMALGFSNQVLQDLAGGKGTMPERIASVLEKHFVPLYNENKLPGLNDGGKARIVDNAMGGDKTIVITGKDGKETTLPATMETLQMLTSQAQGLMMSSASPENYWKHRTQAVAERNADSAAVTAGAAAANAKTHADQLAEQIKAGLFGAQADQAKGAAIASRAAANASNAHASVYNGMAQLARDNAAAGAVMKDYLTKFSALSPEDQNGPRGQALLTEAAVAAAKKTGDVTGVISAIKKPDRSSSWTMSADGSFRSNPQGIVQDFDPKTNMWKTRGLPPVNANAAKIGVIADVSPSGQVGYKGKDGWYSSEQEAVESFTAKAPAKAEPRATAIPEGGNSQQITVSVNPTTKEKSYIVPGVRQRFKSLAEAQEAQKKKMPSGSAMGQALQKFGD